MSGDDPDGAGFWREDPSLNSHHVLWHRIGEMWNAGARWYEMFYYMHNQAVARYRAELYSLGQPLPTNFGPGEWSRHVR